MKRLIITDHDFEAGSELTLDGEKYHYLIRVLRCRKGERIMVGDGKGNFYFGDVDDIEKEIARVKIQEPVSIVWEDRVATVLIQSIPKGNKIERIIRGATELGVSTICPCISRRTMTRYDGEKISDKYQRFKRIAQEAARQCGRPSLPNINEIEDFHELIEKFGMAQGALKLLFWEAEKKFGIYQALKESGKDVNQVVLAVGPEGGWTDDEVSLARKAGFHTIKFGHGILRVETAAISFLSIIKFYFNMTEQSV